MCLWCLENGGIQVIQASLITGKKCSSDLTFVFRANIKTSNKTKPHNKKIIKLSNNIFLILSALNKNKKNKKHQKQTNKSTL